MRLKHTADGLSASATPVWAWLGLAVMLLCLSRRCVRHDNSVGPVCVGTLLRAVGTAVMQATGTAGVMSMPLEITRLTQGLTGGNASETGLKETQKQSANCHSNSNSQNGRNVTLLATSSVQEGASDEASPVLCCGVATEDGTWNPEGGRLSDVGMDQGKLLQGGLHVASWQRVRRTCLLTGLFGPSDVCSTTHYNHTRRALDLINSI